MDDDDVQLTDLEVIQQFSLAVRGATASRSQVVAALEADLAYLNGGARRRAVAPASAPARSKAPVAKAPAVKKAATKTTRSRRA